MRRVDAAILAGGRGERLGGLDKGLLEVGGRRIVDRQVQALRTVITSVGGEVLLVADGATLARYADMQGVRTVVDLQPGRGPLAGLEAALRASSAEALLVVGCDLPFLDAGLLTRVRDHAPGAQAVVPRVGGRPQALHARYSRDILPAVEARLTRGELKLLALVDALDAVFLDEPALRVAADDPSLAGLTNVNTPDDLRAAEERARRDGR
jgi:molybdopterin-guanine dinucleotide biosynthesis protein A